MSSTRGTEANTFSIVTRCDRTGEFGVAVASAVPAVGSICPFVRAGVGAVSTQSWVNPYLAVRILDAMQAGSDAQPALNEALAGDDEANLRQVARPQAPQSHGLPFGPTPMLASTASTAAGSGCGARARTWNAAPSMTGTRRSTTGCELRGGSVLATRARRQ